VVNRPDPPCETLTNSGVELLRLRQLARGFSLPGWTDEKPPRPPNEAMLAELRARGLTHVRLPIRLEMVNPRYNPPAEVDRAFRQIDGALETLLRLGFAVSLDMHPGDRSCTRPNRNQPSPSSSRPGETSPADMPTGRPTAYPSRR